MSLIDNTISQIDIDQLEKHLLKFRLEESNSTLNCESDDNYPLSPLYTTKDIYSIPMGEKIIPEPLEIITNIKATKNRIRLPCYNPSRVHWAGNQSMLEIRINN